MNAEKNGGSIGNTVNVQVLGNLGQHPTQGWSSELTGLHAEQRESGQVPEFQRRKRKVIKQWNIYKRVQDWRWFKCQMSQAQFEWCHFQILWNYVCICIYIYISIFIHLVCRMEFSMHSSYHRNCLFGDMRLQGLKVARTKKVMDVDVDLLASMYMGVS